MTRARIASVGPLLILLLGGCHQSANPSIPLSPIGPLGGNSRVPPPATGSYAVPDGYYQGQASTAPSTSGSFAAAAMDASTLTPTAPPALRATSEAFAGDTAVQPASHQSHPTLQTRFAGDGSAAPVGSGLAPRIPASALQHTSAGDATLRPQLRGMGVLDLTSPETMQPTDPPSLRTAGGRYGASESWSGTAPPAFKSLSPVSESGAAAAEGSVAIGADETREVPTTSKTDASEGTAKTGSAALPWRKPRS